METTETTPEPQAGAPEPTPIPQRDPEQVHAYHRAKRILYLGGLAFSLAYWLVWAASAEAFMTWLGGTIEARWLGLIVFAFAAVGSSGVLSLPLDYYSGYVLEKRYDLTNQTPASWLVFQIKGWLVGGGIGGIVLAGFYAALWYGGGLWSVWVWVGIMLLSVGLAKIFPLVILPIFYPAKPLDRPSLTDRLGTLASGSGMTLTGVFNLELSKETKKANAMLTGLGSSRRVYLADTLLDAFDDDQIAVVFAHELGHHVRRHIWKGIGISAVVMSLLVGLIHWRLDPHAGDPSAWTLAVAGLAEVMLIMTVMPLLTGIVTNAILRHFERRCDADALRLTDDPAAFRAAFEKLTALNMVDANPPRWEEILFDDHPAMSKRIAQADAYEQAKS